MTYEELKLRVIALEKENAYLRQDKATFMKMKNKAMDKLHEAKDEIRRLKNDLRCHESRGSRE